LPSDGSAEPGRLREARKFKVMATSTTLSPSRLETYTNPLNG
jgi:hypothetical protein